MNRVWDYFMRRKGLILLFLAVFVLGGILSYHLLTGKVAEATPEYIHIDNIGKAVAPEEVEIPHTGEITPPVVLAVMRPGELVALEREALPPFEAGESHPDEVLQEPPLPEENEGDDNQQVVTPAEDTEVPEQTETPEAAEKEAAPDQASMVREETQPKMSVGYLIWLTICGLVAAGLGVYLLEQHFMR